jgi:hypothetical protein
MPFDWRVYDGRPLEQRFDGGLLEAPIFGLDAWSRFLRSLSELRDVELDRAKPEDHETLLSVFREFLGVIDSGISRETSWRKSSVVPVVFVSHQRLDIKEAERVADLASNYGIDYWLDIHDPLLILANQQVSPTDARYPIIIAAIIEIALLNSTYLIAVHTRNSLGSKWIPYELGRGKDLGVWSANAGGWFHPRIRPTDCGDYVQLCRIAHGGEHEVKRWLGLWATKSQGPHPGRRNPGIYWRGNPTTTLP